MICLLHKAQQVFRTDSAVLVGTNRALIILLIVFVLFTLLYIASYIHELRVREFCFVCSKQLSFLPSNVAQGLFVFLTLSFQFCEGNRVDVVVENLLSFKKEVNLKAFLFCVSVQDKGFFVMRVISNSAKQTLC